MPYLSRLSRAGLQGHQEKALICLRSRRALKGFDGNIARRGSAGSLLPPQRDDALEVAGLREEVERLHGRERIAGGEELLQVAHLRRRIA